MSPTETNTEEKKSPPKISRGERIFDWLVYGGLAGLGTYIVSIPIGYWVKYGKGAEFNKNAAKKLTSFGFSQNTAEKTMDTTMLMHGGNIMLLPIKYAEDNKESIVTTINDMIGEKTDHIALHDEDKQSWGSIIKARIVAWCAVFAGFKGAASILGEEKFGRFEESFSKKACALLGKPTHINGKETTAFRMGKIGALDTYATIAASSLLYIGTRLFAHMERVQHDLDKEHTAHNPSSQHPAQTDVEPGAKTVASILATKAPAKDFATAALASRTGEQLQLGA